MAYKEKEKVAIKLAGRKLSAESEYCEEETPIFNPEQEWHTVLWPESAPTKRRLQNGHVFHYNTFEYIVSLVNVHKPKVVQVLKSVPTPETTGSGLDRLPGDIAGFRDTVSAKKDLDSEE